MYLPLGIFFYLTLIIESNYYIFIIVIPWFKCPVTIILSFFFLVKKGVSFLY